MKNCVRLVGERLRPRFHYIGGLRIVFLLGTLGLSCFVERLSAHIQPVPDPARIVVLANSKDPQSLQLAQYYAQKRAIPSSHVLALPLSTKETIDWDDYVASLHNPLLTICQERGWVSGVPSSQPDEQGRHHLLVAVPAMDYLVCMRGVPVRIKASPAKMARKRNSVPKAADKCRCR